jgi:hypothetical protein
VARVVEAAVSEAVVVAVVDTILAAVVGTPEEEDMETVMEAEDMVAIRAVGMVDKVDTVVVVVRDPDPLMINTY